MTIERVFNSAAKYGENLTNFLNLVNTAHVTYKGSEVEIDGMMCENSETRFNFTLSVSKYRSDLGTSYATAIFELEDALLNAYNKFDKQFLLVSLIAEVESIKSLLYLGAEDQYHHKLFQYSNISQVAKFLDYKIEESDCQEYYYWMNHYLTKLHNFLVSLKESTEKTQQKDFRVPKSLDVDPNSSTVHKPIDYFDYIFTRNGLYNLRQEFIPSDEEINYTEIQYNAETETITDYYQDQETGEWESSTRTFKVFYENRLYNAYLVSRKLIDDRIHEFNNESSITLFIKLTISHLKYLEIAIKRNPDALKYEVSVRAIKALLKFIDEKYNLFAPIEFAALPETTQDESNDAPKLSQKSLLPPPKIVINTFKWKSDFSQPLSTLLWQNLKEDSKFIDKDTHPDDFHKAFNGSEQEQPLKILWTAKAKSRRVNKHLLLYLLNELSDAGLIYENTDNKTFIKKVGFIFFDNRGNPLKDLKVSNSTAGKNRKTILPEEEHIDDIISQLKRLAGMK
jgi:hypothetical protein